MLVFSQKRIKQDGLALNWKDPISCQKAEFIWWNLYRDNLAIHNGTEILKHKPKKIKVLFEEVWHIKQRPFKNLLYPYHFLLVELTFSTCCHILLRLGEKKKKISKEGREVIVKGEQQQEKKKDKIQIYKVYYMVGTQCKQLPCSLTSSPHFQRVKCAPNSSSVFWTIQTE